VVAFVAFASVLAFLFTLSREANAIANGLNYPVWLISGLLFPITILPVPVRLLGLAMPMAWAREALEWAVHGDLASGLLTRSFWAALGGLCSIGLVYLAAVFFLYGRIIEGRIRYSGQTEAM
jgi:ABC-2 type transport system permease protein